MDKKKLEMLKENKICEIRIASFTAVFSELLSDFINANEEFLTKCSYEVNLLESDFEFNFFSNKIIASFILSDDFSWKSGIVDFFKLLVFSDGSYESLIEIENISVKHKIKFGTLDSHSIKYHYPAEISKNNFADNILLLTSNITSDFCDYFKLFYQITFDSILISNFIENISEKIFLINTKKINLPKNYEGFIFENKAFYNKSKTKLLFVEKDVESFFVPECVLEIGERAFSYCKNLTSIFFSKKLSKIGGYAFLNCEKLENISIPKSVKEILDGAFCDCFLLTSFSFPKLVSKANYKILFGCKNLSFVDLKNVKKICAFSFSQSGLKSIDLKNIEEIGESSFEETLLEEIFVGKKVLKIERMAFSYCKNLKKAKIYSKKIMERAFYRCSKLFDVQVGKNCEIDKYAFEGCQNKV